MIRTHHRLLFAIAVMGSLYLAVAAQEPPGPPQDKGKKAKLFEFGKGPAGKAVSGIAEVLRDKKVQEEIGLVPIQLEELQVLSEQLAFELEPLMRDFQSLPKAQQDARMEDFRREVADRLRGLERDLNRILVPEQQQRLRQAALQLRIRQTGIPAAITAPDVIRELGIGEAEASRLRNALVRIEDKYRQKLLDLQTESEREILALFTPRQQETLKSIVGPLMTLQAKVPGGAPKGKP